MWKNAIHFNLKALSDQLSKIQIYSFDCCYVRSENPPFDKLKQMNVLLKNDRNDENDQKSALI